VPDILQPVNGIDVGLAVCCMLYRTLYLAAVLATISFVHSLATDLKIFVG